MSPEHQNILDLDEYKNAINAIASSIVMVYWEDLTTAEKNIAKVLINLRVLTRKADGNLTWRNHKQQ